MFGRRGKRAAASKEPATALAMVLLESASTLDGEALDDAWRAAWPEHAPPSDVTGENGTLAFGLGGMTAAVSVIPMPVPGGELDGPGSTSWLWPDAADALPRVGAHVVVWVSGPGRAVDAHWHMTRLVTAVVRATGGLGVYLGEAGHLVRADVFDGIAHEYSEGLPVMLWVELRAFVEQGRSSLFTVGMPAFGLMELEIPDSDKEPGELRELALGVAEYLLVEGPVLGDGHTVGPSGEPRVVVRHAPSMVDRPETVYRLEGF